MHLAAAAGHTDTCVFLAQRGTTFRPHRIACVAQMRRLLRPIAADVTRSVDFVSVRRLHGRAAQKGMNRSRCRLSGWG